MKNSLLSIACLFLASLGAKAQVQISDAVPASSDYQYIMSPFETTLNKMVEMSYGDSTASKIINQMNQEKAGLNFSVVNTTWEDTSRFDNSSVGDNITDMWIAVHLKQSELLSNFGPNEEFHIMSCDLEDSANKRKAEQNNESYYGYYFFSNCLEQKGFTYQQAELVSLCRIENGGFDMQSCSKTLDNPNAITPVNMPVFRYSNFEDKTADVPMNKVMLLVGNEKGQELQPISLTHYLENISDYMTVPSQRIETSTSLLSDGDTHALTSAQISFLPVPKGKDANGDSLSATFNPVVYNYQSYEDNPAVLTILATPNGTSATIVDYTRDGFETGRTGQRLFFNNNGDKSSLSATRLDEFLADNPNTMIDMGDTPSVGDQSGINMVLVIQVPLKQVPRPNSPFENCNDCDFMEMAMPMAMMDAGSRSLDLTDAIIGYGPTEGNFVEIKEDNATAETQIKVERDTDYPVRVTVQFYKATDGSGEINEGQIQEFIDTIDEVYANADYVGSLVTNTGDQDRPTDHNCTRPNFTPYYPIWFDNGFEATPEMYDQALDYYYGPFWWTYNCGDNDYYEAAFNNAVESLPIIMQNVSQ